MEEEMMADFPEDWLAWKDTVMGLPGKVEGNLDWQWLIEASHFCE